MEMHMLHYFAEYMYIYCFQEKSLFIFPSKILLSQGKKSVLGSQSMLYISMQLYYFLVTKVNPLSPSI